MSTGIQSIYIVNKSGGLIYHWDAPIVALEVEKTFRYPLDIKLAMKRDAFNRWKVTFGERDGIKVGHTILAINGIPADGPKLQDGREIGEVLEKQENYPINIKFGKIRPSLNERMFFASTFHSLYAIASQLSPEHKTSGIEILESETFKLYCYQTVTGIKFMAVAGPRQTNVDALLRKIFEIYADYGLKNPFYALEQPIRCELFDIHLQQAVEGIDRM